MDMYVREQKENDMYEQRIQFVEVVGVYLDRSKWVDNIFESLLISSMNILH